MRDGFRIFDAHTHVGDARHSLRSYSADQLLRDMDTYGVDRSMVIPFPVVDDARGQHDLIGRAVWAHPDRLSAAACLSPFIPLTDFRDEVRRCRERYGFCALKLQPQYQGLNPFLKLNDFFFEAAAENRMAVICHTGSGLPFASPALAMMPARSFPDLTIVLAHCGGGLMVHEAILAAVFCPNIVLELSTLMPHQILEVLAQVPSPRLMIGSDLPENLGTEIGKILTLPVPDEDRRNILEGTARHAFNAGN